MIDRYTSPEMAKIWSLETQYQCWLEVEIAADEAWSKLGHIPAEDVEKIRKNAKFSVDGIAEIEAVTHHDVIAFTRDVSKSLGPERKWVHYGMTSTDVVDTAQGLRLKKANDIIRKDIDDFMAVLKKMAEKYKYTVCMGRTHGVHAEPTTFGLKAARWYSEMKRNKERFEHAARGVEAGKISGAVGTFAEIDPLKLSNDLYIIEGTREYGKKLVESRRDYGFNSNISKVLNIMDNNRVIATALLGKYNLDSLNKSVKIIDILSEYTLPENNKVMDLVINWIHDNYAGSNIYAVTDYWHGTGKYLLSNGFKYSHSLKPRALYVKTGYLGSDFYSENIFKKTSKTNLYAKGYSQLTNCGASVYKYEG